MPPAELAKRRPAPWLEPQVVGGSAPVSFCILWLNRRTIAPLSPLVDFTTISCAYRIGALDTSVDPPELGPSPAAALRRPKPVRR